MSLSFLLTTLLISSFCLRLMKATRSSRQLILSWSLSFSCSLWLNRLSRKIYRSLVDSRSFSLRRPISRCLDCSRADSVCWLSRKIQCLNSSFYYFMVSDQIRSRQSQDLVELRDWFKDWFAFQSYSRRICRKLVLRRFTPDWLTCFWSIVNQGLVYFEGFSVRSSYSSSLILRSLCLSSFSKASARASAATLPTLSSSNFLASSAIYSSLSISDDSLAFFLPLPSMGVGDLFLGSF